MGWVAIIAALLQVFGPVLLKLLEKWLHLAAASVTVPGDAADAPGAVAAVFDEAVRICPRPGVRALLRAAKPVAVSRARVAYTKASGAAVGVPELTADERAVLHDAAHGAK